MTEHEELLMLRELVEKQKDALLEKAEIIRKQEIQNMIQALLHARKKIFGASSEASKPMKGQLSLFDTEEELAKQLTTEQKKVAVKAHKRVPRQPGIRMEMLSSLPKEVEEYVIPLQKSCSLCGAPLKVIGKEIVRTEVEFQPAKLVVKQIVRQVAKCRECGTKNSSNPKDHFQKASVPEKVLPHSLATHSLVSHIMYQKFFLGISLSRQESDFFCMGLLLHRSTMAYWVIRCSQEWLEPIYWRIHETLVRCDILHMDETRIQCNKESGKKASSDSWMWVIKSAACEEQKATFFYYSKTIITRFHWISYNRCLSWV